MEVSVMNRKVLALALIAMMVLSLVPGFALAADGDVRNEIRNAPVTVDWSRSGKAVDAVAVEIESGLTFDISQIYRRPDVRMVASWTDLNAIDTYISGFDLIRTDVDLVWDGGNLLASDHYTNDHLHGTYTHYPTATIDGEGTVRFTGTFDLTEVLGGASPDGVISNLKIGLDPYETQSGQIALNDQMFVFIYPADAELNDENFMDYYVFGAGFQWIDQWVPENSAGTLTFNGEPMIRSFRDFAYYNSFDEERAAYEAYGHLLTDDGWNGTTNGWFDHGVTYLLNSDLARGDLTGLDHLYVSDGLFFPSMGNELVIEFDESASLPTQWVIDIFAVNTDVVGGLSKLNVIVNFDEETFGKTGNLTIGKTMGQKVDISGSITGGYLYADEIDGVIPTANNGKLNHDEYKHSLSGKFKENGGSWFQFNEFTGEGGSFLLVQGDKLNVVGGYTITADGDGWFTITMDDALSAIGAKVSISNTIQAAQNKNDDAYNANNIWTTAPGQQQFSGSGNSFQIFAPWVNTEETVYVYMHLEGLTGYKDTFGVEAGTTFTVNVMGPSFPEGQDFQVPLNSFISLSGLIPGVYTVKEVEEGYIPTYFVNGTLVQTGGEITVVVEALKTTDVKILNRPGEIQKGSLEITVDVESWHNEVESHDEYTQDWYNEYTQDWYNLYTQDWFDVYKQNWYNEYTQDWYNVYAQDWYNVYAQDWYDVYEPVYTELKFDALSWNNGNQVSSINKVTILDSYFSASMIKVPSNDNMTVQNPTGTRTFTIDASRSNNSFGGSLNDIDFGKLSGAKENTWGNLWNRGAKDDKAYYIWFQGLEPNALIVYYVHVANNGGNEFKTIQRFMYADGELTLLEDRLVDWQKTNTVYSLRLVEEDVQAENLRFVETITKKPVFSGKISEEASLFKTIYKDEITEKILVGDPVFIQRVDVQESKRLVMTIERSTRIIDDVEFFYEVYNAADELVASGPISNGGSEVIDNLVTGLYKVILSGDSIDNAEKIIEVFANQQASANFNDIPALIGADVVIRLDDVINDGEHLTDVINDGEQLPDVFAGEQLPDVVKKTQLDDVFIQGIHILKLDKTINGIQIDDVIIQGVHIPELDQPLASDRVI